MAWTNAFDVGACTVEVGDDVTPDAYFSGVLAKGETSAQFDGYRTNEELTASVTSDGAVQLNWVSGSGPSLGYTLHVVPSYSVATGSMRASGFDIPDGVSGAGGPGGAQLWSSDNGSLVVNLTGSGSAWSPDPADLSEAGFQAFWAIYQGELG